jgi:hypothetical protein
MCVDDLRELGQLPCRKARLGALRPVVDEALPNRRVEAVRLREDYSAEELRALARRSKTVSRNRRLLSLASVRDGMDRGAAAKIGGMDRQTLRDWVHRFNAASPLVP